MRLTLNDGKSYAKLLLSIHHKHFTEQWDSATYHSDGKGNLDHITCIHGGEAYVMTRLEDVVNHIKTFEDK